MTPEGKVSAYLVKRVASLGGETRKVSWEGRAGAPDRLVLLRGVTAFMELKSTSGRASPLQQREIELLRRNGNLVFLCFGKEDVDEALEFMLDKAKRQVFLSEGEDESF